MSFDNLGELTTSYEDRIGEVKKQANNNPRRESPSERPSKSQNIRGDPFYKRYKCRSITCQRHN